MKNKNKFDAMLDVIEAGDTEGLEQQNARHEFRANGTWKKVQ